MKLWKILTNSF